MGTCEACDRILSASDLSMPAPLFPGQIPGSTETGADPGVLETGGTPPAQPKQTRATHDRVVPPAACRRRSAQTPPAVSRSPDEER